MSILMPSRRVRVDQIAVLLGFLIVSTYTYSAPKNKSSPGDISACTTITQPGSYSITQDLPGSGSLLADGSCIAIQASGVSIDIANHAITGLGISSGFGITDGGINYSNISVFDGTVTGFATAINLGASSASIIRNVRATDNTVDGIIVGVESFLLQNVAVRNDRGIVYTCPSNAVANSAWGNSSEDLFEIDSIFCSLFEGHNSYGSIAGSNQACELLGFTSCFDTCTATTVDPSNCGDCGTQCAPGEVCSSGSCALSCQPGLLNCDGTCTNVNSDEDNCGACSSPCSAGQLCSFGTCTAP